MNIFTKKFVQMANVFSVNISAIVHTDQCFFVNIRTIEH